MVFKENTARILAPVGYEYVMVGQAYILTRCFGAGLHGLKSSSHQNGGFYFVDESGMQFGLTTNTIKRFTNFYLFFGSVRRFFIMGNYSAPRRSPNKITTHSSSEIPISVLHRYSFIFSSACCSSPSGCTTRNVLL